MYYSRPGLGDVAANNHHIEVVRIGDRIEMSGQGRLLITICADSLTVCLRFSSIMPPFFASHVLYYGKIINVLNKPSLLHTGGHDPQTGEVPPDLSTEISNAFSTISDVIKYALRDQSVTNGWDKVFKVVSYHVNLKETDKEVLELMVQEMRKLCPEHRPVWTLIGVERLAEERMRVEVEVVVYDGK